MMWSKIQDNQLYVFWNGVCIYKKWFRDNTSVITDIRGAWWKADRDEGRRWDPEWNNNYSRD